MQRNRQRIRRKTSVSIFAANLNTKQAWAADPAFRQSRSPLTRRLSPRRLTRCVVVPASKWVNRDGAPQANPSRTHIVVRTASDPAGVTFEIERAARSIDKDVPVYNSETISQHTAESLWQQRTAASWIGAFSLIALVLAAVGLYSVIAQSVAQRTREVGIRMALGGEPGSVARMVIREGMTMALIGMAVGVPAAIASGRIMRRLVTGIGGADLPILAMTGGVLAMVTLVACWLPARRAARVDPLIALRYE
jgi:putative ABC transport system permease protein